MYIRHEYDLSYQNSPNNSASGCKGGDWQEFVSYQVSKHSMLGESSIPESLIRQDRVIREMAAHGMAGRGVYNTSGNMVCLFFWYHTIMFWEWGGSIL